MPQFVDPARGSVTWQLLVLGCVFVTLAVVSDSMHALLAGSLGQWLKRRHAFWRAERYVVGSIYLGLGVTAALADIKRH